MGLSSLPSPSEGVLCIILVNTAISIQLFKGIMRSILHIFGINLPSSPSDSVDTQSEAIECRLTPSETFLEEFRSRIPTIRFSSVLNSIRSDHDCSVCLTRFEPDSEINSLCCGHVYHKTCLEKWLDYWNITCPLCRNPLLPQEQEESTCIW